MTTRRDVLLGVACVLSATTAVALTPRQKVSLLGPGQKLSNILPRRIPGWESRDVSDLYAPETPDSLQARLYGETVGRVFVHEKLGTQVMMLMAHGDSQSNELQLHRPEVCYPAFGLAIVGSSPIEIAVGKRTSVPGRRLIAQSSQQRQAVVYWTRLGEYFPISVTEQRLDRLDTAVHRYIPDGLLARFSVAGSDTSSSFDEIQAFIPEFVAAVAPDQRGVLIGTARKQKLLA